MTTGEKTLLLRLAGPLQSWGLRSEFNRRDTHHEPTWSGVLGLLAASQGRRRGDDLSELLGLSFAVRTDQSGSLLRDYHTVSDFRGTPLLSASVDSKGRQRRTSPAKFTHVTQRYYLQDAVFVAAVRGPAPLIETLGTSVRNPVFPLSLGRRSCVPGKPLFIDVVSADLRDALTDLPWQAGAPAKAQLERRKKYAPRVVPLAVSATAPAGTQGREQPDLPVSFHPVERQYAVRTVQHFWVEAPTGIPNSISNTETNGVDHDPFDLLSW